MVNTATQDGSGTRTSVSRSLDVIDELVREERLGVTELASRLDLSKSTVHAYLKTLEQAGYVVRAGNKYRLAYALSLLGESVRNQSRLFRIAREEIDELAADTGLYAHLTVEENGKSVNLYQAKGGDVGWYDYQSRKVQRPEPLHITATGKAILASLSRSTAESIVDAHGLPERTPETITDRESLFDQLETIRERGYAYNDEEEVLGFRAVGAPISDPYGDVLGAVSISGPTSILNGDRFHEESTSIVTRTANLIEVTINMSDEFTTELMDD
ncbi:IclR family transcriptional regulator [Halorubrum sp. AD140]|uniref:IclR family transcriptional regulator n=1 Tax=Halorubrum sp. AD140 TaxID=3050073 RepID=UPI002ACCE28C|nr:IclR family transcriptional regulator [Halorubrum sp. AD140]MDZ5811553.1 IclR family transcriptional regulator [Halorubrum sp. AD140]